MPFIARLQQKRLEHFLKQFPVVCLTGSRQTGKSTLLKHVQKPHWEYVNLDQRSVLEQVQRDPDLFVRDLKTPAILDEAQKAPAVFHSIKAEVDAHPHKRFILSGSANFHLMQNISETLAGRTGILELFPFSVGELLGLPQPRFLSDLLGLRNIADLQALTKDIKISSLLNPYSYILWGGMPKIWQLSSSQEKTDWFENYRTTYIERDLRNLAQVGNLDDFQKFYQSIAFQTANKLNLSNLAKDIGVSVPTCKRYLDIMRTSYQAFTLPAYHINIRKRLVKTPKCYMLDTGIVSFLLRYESEEMLQKSGRLGVLFETWVLGEIKKVCATLPVMPSFHYWHPHAGYEVDVVLEVGERLYPMEIKHISRLEDGDIRGLQEIMQDITSKQIPFGVLWYRGDRVLTVAPRILAIPVEYLWH